MSADQPAKSQTTDDADVVPRALRDAINETAPWPPLVDTRSWGELPESEREYFRFLVRRVREAH